MRLSSGRKTQLCGVPVGYRTRRRSIWPEQSWPIRDPGKLTFLFTDIEGSSELWERATATMEQSVARREEILPTSIEANRGRIVKTLAARQLAWAMLD